LIKINVEPAQFEANVSPILILIISKCLGA